MVASLFEYSLLAKSRNNTCFKNKLGKLKYNSFQMLSHFSLLKYTDARAILWFWIQTITYTQLKSKSAILDARRVKTTLEWCTTILCKVILEYWNVKFDVFITMKWISFFFGRHCILIWAFWDNSKINRFDSKHVTNYKSPDEYLKKSHPKLVSHSICNNNKDTTK